MSLSEIIPIKESNKKLDSLIKLIQERAQSVTINSMPDLSKIEYYELKLKKGAQPIKLPKIDSIDTFHIFSSFQMNCMYSSFTDDKNLIIYIKDKLTNKFDWFYNLGEILQAIQNINNSTKFKIDTYNSLNNIYNYIGQKVAIYVTNHFYGYRNGEPILIERMRNHIETKNKAKKENRNIVKSNETDFLDYMLTYSDENIKKENATPFEKFQIFLKGKCESEYLTDIYNNYIYNIHEYKEGEKLLVVFDLFKLVIKDKVLYTKDEFISSNSSLSNYNAYMKKTIKNILILK